VRLEKFLHSWRGAIAENRAHRIVALGLTAALLAAVFGLLRQEPVVVLVPPKLHDEIWVASNDAHAEYAKTWGLFLAELLGNVTPGNVDFIADAISPLLAPGIHKQVMETLHRQAEAIRRDRVNLRFTPRTALYERSSRKVFVEGYGFASGAGSKDEKREARTYEFVIAVERYAPLITHMDVYGERARTEKVLDREASKSENGRKGAEKNAP
jgi:conjugal transfer pilus assembly protein TraE